MKSIAYISVVGLCVFFSSCNKNEPSPPAEPEPLLNRLDSIADPSKPFPKKIFVYDANNLVKAAPYRGNPSGTTYSYNSEGLVTKITVVVYAPPYHSSRDVTINYQNGIPVSGKFRNFPGDYKTLSVYQTDSILYKVTNGKVTEIKYIDHKEYRTNNELLYFAPGTRSIHTLTYQGNNLTRIETANAAAKVMTYGTRKGIFSSYRQKFVLWENEDPTMSAENDLISIVEPFNEYQPFKWQKTTYTHQYNAAGYPKSAVVSRTDVNGQTLETYNLKYFYR